jgi:excisionase family DNA binding protein
MKSHGNATPSLLMKSTEVAHYLRVNQGTLYKLIRRGHIPAFKVGSDYRFDRNAIERLMTNRQGKG